MRNIFSKQQWRARAGLTLLVATAACSQAPTSGEDVSSAAQAQVVFGPSEDVLLANSKWRGNQVELLAADAYYSCTNVRTFDLNGVPDGLPRRRFETVGDRFLENLTTNMLMLEEAYRVTIPTPPPYDVAKDWSIARIWMSGTTFDPELAFAELLEVPGLRFANDAAPTQLELALDTDFRTAGFNLCMAQFMRRNLPGSAANTGLFLPEDQQRQLLEIVRERSQIAMLQYSLFASVLAAPELSPGGATDQARLGHISTWLHHLPNDVRTKMGKDFGTAAQLNVMATEEMAQLLGRSRSKREPYGRIPADRAESFWGTSSWYQREMALFFGGDPLAMEATPDGGAPWKGLVAAPGAGTNGDTWPDAAKLQSFHQELLEPQPQLLLQMARQKGVLKLLLAAPNPCTNVNVTDSAQTIYDNVEKKLHDEACDATANNQCVPWTLPPNYPDESYWLLTKHRITRAHATAMVTWLAQGLTYAGSSCPGSDLTTGYEGALSIDSTIPFSSGPAPAQADPAEPPTVVWDSQNSPNSIEIKPHASLQARPLSSIGALYSRMAPIYFGDVRDIVPNHFDVGVLGFNGRVIGGWNYGAAAESKRVLGAIPAHAVVRRLMSAAIAATSSPNNPPSEPFIAAAALALPLSAAAGGGTALSLRPELHPISIFGLQLYVSTGAYRPTLVLDDASSDIRCDGGVNGETCTLYALFDQPDGADLAAHPNAVFVKNGQKLNVSSIVSTLASGGALAPLWGGRAIQFDPIDLSTSASGIVSFVLERRRNSVHTKWDAIASHVKVRTADIGAGAYDGQDIAFGGELGTIAARANEPLQRNPVEPAYDGFGWETHWVPPLSAAFLGGDPNQPSVDPMLKIAEQSAAEAEEAINSAVTGLLERQKDAASVAAAQSKSNQAIKQERDGLCGPNATKAQCDLGKSNFQVRPSLLGWYQISYPGIGSCSAPNPTTSDQIDCLYGTLFQNVEATEVRLANAVIERMFDGNAPSFEQYSGGSLQSAFIEQWRAVRTLGAKLQAISDRAAAARSAAAVASAELEFADLDQKNACGERIFIGAVAGVSSGFPAGVSCNLGPLMTAINECALLTAKMDVNRAKKVNAQLEAVSSLSAAMVDGADLLAALQQSSAKVGSLVNQASMAAARADLDADLAKSTAVTSFPLYRNFRDADLWRAKATVESARRYALAARRALEARYVVDLTRLDQKETFVSAPSVWADDIYGYDLSLPSAVGLTIPTSDQKDPNAIYKAAIKDYVANLRGFMNGYAASRPSAVAQEDIDVVNLSGFVPFGNAKESPGAWQLLCGTNWVGLDAYKDAPGGWNCGTSQPGPKATRARVGFVLDPWGRLNGTIGNEPYTKRYNTRWGKVALNVVGTGVKDCSLANDPLACYANSTIRYNLTHVTPTWTTDYDGLWRQQDMPLGQIEGGKGLAVELFLNPLKDGWNTQFIAAVARTEYLFRPAGGAYNLEFEVTPEVMLQRIERMQLLVGTSAWVKQK